MRPCYAKSSPQQLLMTLELHSSCGKHNLMAWDEQELQQSVKTVKHA